MKIFCFPVSQCLQDYWCLYFVVVGLLINVSEWLHCHTPPLNETGKVDSHKLVSYQYQPGLKCKKGQNQKRYNSHRNYIFIYKLIYYDSFDIVMHRKVLQTLVCFVVPVREYDSSVMCGLVWTTNFVAYRCRTCAISPCMSLCADCFQAGNHEGHDYNMFRSQAGGACDCGDTNVMNSAG